MTKREKLALIVPGLELGRGGVHAVAKFLVGVIREYTEYNLELISLCMASHEATSVSLSRPGTWRRGITARKSSWQGVPLKHVGALFSELEFKRYKPRKALTRILEDCDLIQVVCGSPAWANTVTGLGKPVALQVATMARVERRMRDAHPRSLADWWRKSMTEITDRLDNKALQSVDAIQVENPWMLDYAEKVNKGRKVDLRYAPPGVDADVFFPKKGRDIPSNPYILSVSRLNDPRKNVAMLLDAYTRLPNQLKDHVDLILAGLQPPPNAFWKRVAQYGVQDRVKYVARPSNDELVKLYQNASVFALSSDEEGLGMVILEAMACGIPVVSTRCGGPDGIISDGVDGFLVPLGDAEMMARNIEVLLEDVERNKQVGQCARLSIENRYSKERAGKVFIEMWEKMLMDRGTC